MLSAKTIIGAALVSFGIGQSAQAVELCGFDGNWIGGSEASSDISTASTYQEQLALVLGERAYVALFNLSAETNIRIEARAQRSGDPMFELYSEDGVILMSDDDSGGEDAARIEGNYPAGNYCVVVKSYDASPMAGFVRVGRLEHDALTTGLNGSSANVAAAGGACGPDTSTTPLPFGVDVSAPAGDFPFWRFVLEEEKAVVVTAMNEAADPFVALYDATGALLGENDDWETLDSRLEMMEVLPAGAYCVNLRALSDETLPITLRVDTFDIAEAMRAQIDRGEKAPPLDGSHPVAQLGTLTSVAETTVENTHTAQWFQFELPEDSVLFATAEASTGGGDSQLWLYSADGTAIAYNDDHGDSLDPALFERLAAGTYIIGLSEIEEASVSTTGLTLERYVRAE